jgi:electron transport complex protein RnfB
MLSVKSIDALLPQTQCTRCGYPRCRDYARAIGRGEAQINRCPPGGAQTIAALAHLTAATPLPLDPECGAHRPRTVARIIEADCIGCTKCIQVCPADAILGGAKRMHTVFVSECTGCELCLPACPVDCIALDAVDVAARTGHAGIWTEYTVDEAALARRRTVARLRRLARLRRERKARFRRPARKRAMSSPDIRDEIRAAVARVKQKRGQPT